MGDGWRCCSGRKRDVMTGESMSLSFANRNNTKSAYIGIYTRGQKQVYRAPVPFFCINKAVVVIVTSKSFSMCTAVSLLLPTPVFVYTCHQFLWCKCPHIGHVLLAIPKAWAIWFPREP